MMKILCRLGLHWWRFDEALFTAGIPAYRRSCRRCRISQVVVA